MKKKRILALFLTGITLMMSAMTAFATESGNEAAPASNNENVEASPTPAPEEQAATPTPDAAPTATPEATATPVPEKTPEATPTATPEASATPEATPTPTPEKAEAPTSKPFLALGADLDAGQEATVLRLLGLEGADLSNYDVVRVTNAEEHKYLDGMVDSKLIGTKSWSSVLINQLEEGAGINVSIFNINYCTEGMYKNALVTAGIKDANVVVAGPKPIAGTAALIGVAKAYENMTGEELPEDSLQVATNELVVTGELADSIGDSQKVEELVALIKQYIAENGLDSEEDILEVIDKAADKLEIELSEKDRQMLLDLMKKFSELDIDVNALLDQAKDIYDKLSGMDLDLDLSSSGIGGFFSKIWNAIVGFFKGLFS